MNNKDMQEKQNEQCSDSPAVHEAGVEHLLLPFPPEPTRGDLSQTDAEARKIHSTPPFGETLAIYLLSGVLLVVLGSMLQYFHLLSGLLISQIAFIVGPAYLYTVFRGYNISQTFSFAPIGLRTALLAIVIACSAFALVGIVAVLQEMLFPRSAEYAAAWEEIMLKFQQAPPVLTLFIVSLLPGVCEELLFRGFLLRGMREKISAMPAVILVGLLFGLFHLDFYRFLPVSLLGILFGYIVVKTGSIFPAMLAHSVNNAITIFLSYGTSRVQEVEQLTDSPQLKELLSLQGALGLLALVTVAVSVLWAALRALPGPDDQEARPTV